MLIKGLNVKILNKEILKEINLEINKGINLILGPNGSGKTTLLRTIIGMIKPSGGEIVVNEDKSYVPAEFFEVQMKVIDVLLSGGKYTLERYKRYIQFLNVERYLNRDFSTLSTGEKKIVLITKALSEGNLVIMDEPTSGLDMRNSIIIMKVIKKIKDKTFLITTHDVNMIQIADNVILIKGGKIVFQGNPKDVTEDILSELYEIPIKKYEINGEVFFKAI
ncbi:ATP-binding cassette domain-containing protein [Acidianus brierleyi]|uniref:Iron ABC transporter ATP-binding protein n=1 Tax=Acidianus brierleyi TaxID=41673 RepID=A0A2U9IDR3_9CREN|nr:ABC transporter ATP-binding protein [Acidianus brierleyi]AWR94171.1 ATP-binding cassette domain-containing protein [Acidianus brierleyi]